MTLQELARMLGGEVQGHQVLAPGPGHSPKDRSLAVKPSSTAPDGFVVYSHAGDDPIVCKDYVRERSWTCTVRGASASAEPPRRAGDAAHHGEDAERRRGAQSRLRCASGKKLSRCAYRHRVGGTRSRSAGGTSRNVAGCTLDCLMTCPTHFVGTRVSAPSLR